MEEFTKVERPFEFLWGLSFLFLGLKFCELIKIIASSSFIKGVGQVFLGESPIEKFFEWEKIPILFGVEMSTWVSTVTPVGPYT